MQASFPELCLVLGFLAAMLWSQELLCVLLGCPGRGFPDTPLPSLAQSPCSGRAVPWSCSRERQPGNGMWGGTGDPAKAAASVLHTINFCKCAFCSFPVLVPLPQPGAFVSNGSLETQWMFSFEVKGWKLTCFEKVKPAFWKEENEGGGSLCGV